MIRPIIAATINATTNAIANAVKKITSLSLKLEQKLKKSCICYRALVKINQSNVIKIELLSLFQINKKETELAHFGQIHRPAIRCFEDSF